MREVGPVVLDMQQLTLGVVKEGKKVILQAGSKSETILQLINGATLYRMCAQQECGFIGQLNYTVDKPVNKPILPATVNELLH